VVKKEGVLQKASKIEGMAKRDTTNGKNQIISKNWGKKAESDGKAFFFQRKKKKLLKRKSKLSGKKEGKKGPARWGFKEARKKGGPLKYFNRVIF